MHFYNVLSRDLYFFRDIIVSSQVTIFLINILKHTNYDFSSQRRGRAKGPTEEEPRLRKMAIKIPNKGGVKT